MKICIYGLGAIGGLVAARLARSGQHVSAVARGVTLDAVRREGLLLLERDGDNDRRTRVEIEASDRPGDLGEQDLVVLTVKTTGLAQVAHDIGPLLGPRTAVLSMMNGVQWWFFHGLAQRPPGLRLESVDPGGAIAAAIPPEHVIGSVTHLSSASPEPGVIRHGMGERIIVGEPSGGQSGRSMAAIDALRRGGFQVEEAPRIQSEIWFKLWGNMTMNPVSAITGATGDRILDDDLVRGFLSRCMREAAQIGARIGLPIDVDPEARHAVTRALGALRTSMLQDVEAGRMVELDALVASVVEIGAACGVPTPDIETLLGLARLHARVRGLYPG
ncbi:MAG TPA: 2-dehydropantoate 2-reductase [Quisquiliibacterium sp.]|nr:2-dehydropantoate 2-reductase [Quisquiliibacterium sp.]HQN11874.1 2-dehydropantoate 2-reductase [Quisquiliibacterium sp.]HQP66009.1 2-dehydropantoate 2-reductase [Quisquiliibacterium sp.]